VLDRVLSPPTSARVRLALALASLLLLGPAAGSASAELTQKGNLFVRFDGGITPVALPRSTPAPISVRIEGRIRVPDEQEPPALREISIALNKGGRLDTTGLPVCRRSQVELAEPAVALAACGPALVGSGGIVGRTELPGQERAQVRADVLLFNAAIGARRAILAHVYQKRPPAIYNIVFSIKHTAGTFGTVITGRLPTSVNRSGYLESIFLQLERRYSYRGRQRSYLSASCAAPAGTSLAVFPFARASMSFDDGRTLSATMVRSCRVKR
jgi:hypothetical protein